MIYRNMLLAKVTRHVTLGIGIYAKNLIMFLRHRFSKSGRDSSFTDTTFLIDDSNSFHENFHHPYKISFTYYSIKDNIKERGCLIVSLLFIERQQIYTL